MYASCFVAASCQFTSTPRNQAVIRGEKLQLEWKTESDLSSWKWAITQPSGIGNTRNFVSNKLNFTSKLPHFHYNERDSSMAIYTDAVKLEDGGNYTFEYRTENESSLATFAVQITVLGS